MAEMKTLKINDIIYDVVDANAVKFIPQELTEEQKAQARENIGAASLEDNAIPTYWENHIASKIQAIKRLQREGGKDCYSFVVLTDYHSTSNARHSPVLIKKVMDECSIKFCLCLGDTQNQGVWGTKTQELADWEEIENDFKPIRDRTLMIAGNHDGAYGSYDKDGDGTIAGTDYYAYNLTREEMYDLICRKVGLINGVVFDELGDGYYVDDTVNKARYILVNTHYSNGDLNADGTATNNYMRKTRVGQSQHNMIIEALSTIPNDDWTVVVGSHMPLVAFEGEGGGGDLPILLNVLTAYQNKEVYSGTFGEEGSYDRVDVNVDFTSAKGSVVGAFAGHLHKDLDNFNYDFPIILSRSDGRPAEEKNLGTTGEQSFDVFTVNKKTGALNAIKFGDGANRDFTALPYTNLADRTSEDWYDSGWLKAVTTDDVTEAVVDTSNAVQSFISNYIPVTQYDILRFKGIDTETVVPVVGARPTMFLFDENKQYINYQAINSASNGITKVFHTDENGVTSYEILLSPTGIQWTYNDMCTRVKYVRFCCLPLGSLDDIIITVNEEIV